MSDSGDPEDDFDFEVISSRNLPTQEEPGNIHTEANTGKLLDTDNSEILHVDLSTQAPTSKVETASLSSEEEEDEEVIATHSRSVSSRKRKKHTIEIDEEIDEYEEEASDDLIIIGSDGETKEKAKTTQDLLNEKNESSMDLKQVKCPICFDQIEKTVALPCGHFYCSDCVYQAMANSQINAADTGMCALCRKRIKYKDLVWLKFKFKKKPKEVTEVH